MNDSTLFTPLLRWDGLHLVLNLKMVERYLQRQLGGLEWLSDLELVGGGDTIRIRARVLWKGMSSRVAVELTEIRLRHRRLGFRLRRSRAPGWMPVPRPLLETAINAVDSDIVTVVRGHGILVVDLRQWIPHEVAVSVRTVQATRSYLHIWLGPGAVYDLPGDDPLRLPSG
jgi:hypothetical protein